MSTLQAPNIMNTTTTTSNTTNDTCTKAEFKNVLHEPLLLKCPYCGKEDLTEVEVHLKWWADFINRLTFCLYHCCCCCICCSYRFPCMQSIYNHYCKHCHCHLGRMD